MIDANTLLVKSYQYRDTDLLQAAVELGADVNGVDDHLGEPLFVGAVYDYGILRCQSCEDDYEYLDASMFAFTDCLLESGLDLNRTWRTNDWGLDSTAHHVLAWSFNCKFVEYLINRGMVLNHTLEEGDESVMTHTLEEMGCQIACGNSDRIGYLHEASRLLVRYGALPSHMLRGTKSEEEKRLCETGASLNLEGLKEISGAAILKHGIDRVVVEDSKFMFTKEYADNPEALQKRIISALDIILDKAPVGKLNAELASLCVDDEYADVLSYLAAKVVKKGFASALETLKFCRSRIGRSRCRKMKKILES